MKYIFCFLAFCLWANATQAETLEEKVSRNNINCLAGHITTDSVKYRSGETDKYLALAMDMLGKDRAREEIQSAIKKITLSSELLGSSLKEEGQYLVDEFCPGIDEILKNKKI